jgi:hypothetical protein
MRNPIDAAKKVFGESLVSIMAHTIRGLENHLRRTHVELDLRIISDQYDTITRGATSVLKTRLTPEKNRVIADIFLHKHANKNLARICVAHEIYHLLVEFEQWRSNGRLIWEPIPHSKELEDACNQFAWELCRQHDKFNRSERCRENEIYFPDGVFNGVLTTDISRSENWPKGLAIDPDRPFTKPPVVDIG